MSHPQLVKMSDSVFFGLLYQGNVKDYQLWVISKRENAPYPLIGQWVSSSLAFDLSSVVDSCVNLRPFRGFV